MRIRLEKDGSAMLTLVDPDSEQVVLTVVEPSKVQKGIGEMVAGLMRAWLHAWEARVNR